MESNIPATISATRLLLAQEQHYFTPALLGALMRLGRQPAYRLTERMVQDGLAAKVEKGKYLLLGLAPEQVLSNPLFIANQLVTPGYISYWSALHHYGLTTQAPQTVFCATTRKKPPITFQGFYFRYVLIKPHKFFGYRRETIGGLPVLIADPAKTIVDCLDQPRYSGGLSEIAQALRSGLPDLDLELLAEYAIRMQDKSLSSRLGYLLETLGRPSAGLPVSLGPVALDPERPRAGSLEARWNIVVNAPADELFPAGVG